MPDNSRLRANGPLIIADVGALIIFYITVVMGGGNPRGSLAQRLRPRAPDRAHSTPLFGAVRSLRE
jgi:hypothetical protein